TLNAIVEPVYEQAKERARSVAAGSGPLAGLPIVIKDYVQIAGAPVFMANRTLKELDVRPLYTSSTARRLAKAGAVNLGTSHAPEFGAGDCPASAETALYGPARNPWDSNRTPMGSSGGSAAAVAAGIVAIAHASDGGGSTRIPAAACGLVGLKPSRHRISASPGADAWSGYATDGVVTRSVRDSALGLDVLAGPETGDTARPLQSADSYLRAIDMAPPGLRIGFTTDFEFTDSARSCKAAVETAASTLESLGHVVENTYPQALATEDPLWPFGVVMSANIAALLQSYESRIGRTWQESDMEPGTWENYQKGTRRAAAEFVAAQTSLTRWSRNVAAWWDDDGYDVLLTPVLGADPPAIGTLTQGTTKQRAAALRPLGPFTWQFNITGQPAISLPFTQTEASLPIGIQLVASHGRDDLLLRLAAQLEAETKWSNRTPPISAATM
ncbi:MAG: amidase, partial [Acidimicrobiales bacterium]